MKKLLSIFTIMMFVATQAFAQPQTVVLDEHKGLQRNPKADKIESQAHSIFNNVLIEDGNIQVVKGRDKLNTTANADTTVNMLCYYENEAGTTKKLVVKEIDEIVTYDTDGTNRTQIAATLTNERADCVQQGDSLYITSSTDGIYKWSGTGSATLVATATAVPSAPTVVVDTTTAGGLTPGIEAVATTDGTSDSDPTVWDSSSGACTAVAGVVGFNTITFIQEEVACSTLDTATGFNCVPGDDSDYKYLVTGYSSKYGLESEPSTSNTVALSGSNDVTTLLTGGFSYWNNNLCSSTNVRYSTLQFFYTGEETATDVTVPNCATGIFDTCRIYRTTQGGSDFFFVADANNEVFDDGKPDSVLGPTLDTTIDLIAPPSFRYIEEYKGALFVAEDDEVRFTRVPVNIDASADQYWLDTDQLTIGANDGSITGLSKSSDSLLIFTDKNIKELTGFGVSTFRLRTLIEGIGATNDETIEVDTQGDIIFFAGSLGVYKLRTFAQPQDELTGGGVDAPRISLQKLSGPVLDDVFRGEDNEIILDPADYSSAHAYYDKDNDFYFLYIGDKCLLFDNRDGQWSYLPNTKMVGSVYRRSINEVGRGVLFDNLGFIYDNWRGYELGVESGTVEGNPTSSTASTLTDSGAAFNITGDGLAGVWIFIDNESNNGRGEYRQILSNTATAITIDGTWGVNPISSDDYYIGYIIPEWRTKQYQIEKAPSESRTTSFWVINNLAPAAQDLEYFAFENKSDDPSTVHFGVIDLSAELINKVSSRMRNSWVQWGFRSFVYNISNTVNTPVDITAYAVKVDVEEAK